MGRKGDHKSSEAFSWSPHHAAGPMSGDLQPSVLPQHSPCRPDLSQDSGQCFPVEGLAFPCFRLAFFFFLSFCFLLDCDLSLFPMKCGTIGGGTWFHVTELSLWLRQVEADWAGTDCTASSMWFPSLPTINLSCYPPGCKVAALLPYPSQTRRNSRKEQGEGARICQRKSQKPPVCFCL